MDEEETSSEERGLRAPGNERSEDRMSPTRDALPMNDGLSGARPQVATVIPEEEIGREGAGMELDADHLAEVFSHLSFADLFEVMLVSRHWGKTVMEADPLWRKVEVVRNWDDRLTLCEGLEGMEGMGERRLEPLNQVLRVAPDVRFLRASDDDDDDDRNNLISAGLLFGPKLRSLELPDYSVDTVFLTAFESTLPHLESLTIKGEPLAYKGETRIRICHPKLETLTFKCGHKQPIALICPNLTSPSIDGSMNGPLPALQSFACPHLKKLCLSTLYITPQVLMSFAQCAPNISRLELGCGREPPHDALIYFKSLEHLVLQEVYDKTPFLPMELTHLETLVIDGEYCAHNLEVRFCNLRELTIQDLYGLMSPTLDCPRLLALSLRSTEFAIEFLENLNSSCPILMKVGIERLCCGGRADRSQGPLYLFHETLES